MMAAIQLQRGHLPRLLGNERWLAISPATVKTHLSRIHGKLGATNRREAARKAKQLGLI